MAVVSLSPKWLSLVLLAGLLQGAWSWPWESYTSYQDGAKAYEGKRYGDSIPFFERGVQAAPEQALPYYNLGNAYYQNKNYAKAIETYQKALTYSMGDEMAGALYYNLGNALYRQGQQDGYPEKNWQHAIEAYEKALSKTPQDKEATENRDFVKQQLEKLQQLAGNNSQPNPSEKEPSSSKNQPNPSKPSSPGPGASVQPPASPGPQNQNSNSSSEPPSQYSQQQVQRFLDAMERAERRNRANQLFRRYPQKRAQSNDLFNMSPEQLMTLTPEELKKLFEQNRPNSGLNKDW